MFGNKQWEDITAHPEKYDQPVIYWGKILLRGKRRRIQEKEDGHADENYSQHSIEPTGALTSYISHDKLCVLGCEEPVPVQNGCQQGDDSCYDEDALNDILAHI